MVAQDSVCACLTGWWVARRRKGEFACDAGSKDIYIVEIDTMHLPARRERERERTNDSD